MTYKQLMKSLDKITAYPMVLNFVTLMLIFIGLAFIVGLFCLYLMGLTAEEEKDKLNKKDKKFILWGTLICVIVVIASYFTRDNSVLSLKEKQTVKSSQVEKWEAGNDIQDYFITLPNNRSKIITAAPTEKVYSRSYHENGYNITIEDPYYPTVKISLFVKVGYVLNENRDNLGKDEPQESYLEYHIVPKTISHNYRKGTIIPTKAVLVR